MTNDKEIEDLLKNIDDINLEDLKASESKEEVSQETTANGSGYSIEGPSLNLGNEVSEEHKIVSQLDEVTKESEEKATELFDIMNDLSSDIMWAMERFESMKTQVEDIKSKNIKDIEENIETIEDDLSEVDSLLNHANNIIFEGMSLMQYQDISRQKIERVVNVLRSLIKYLNLLFEGKTSDKERTSSAAHLVGDGTDDLMGNNDDLEDLINSFK